MPRETDPHDDVRMRGFIRRSTVEQAWSWLDGRCAPLEAELTPLAAAAGRVLAAAVVSQYDVPGFDRAMMDGYAVRAADTQGAAPYQPLRLTLAGDAFPGRPAAGRVTSGVAIRVMTGAPMPNGADAVLPAENAAAAAGTVECLAEVTPGKHVGPRGEDVRAGDVVLPAGRRMRPQDIGVLSSIGASAVPLVRRPRVRIVVTGDELLPAGSPPQTFRIADSNGPMLAALVERDGGLVERDGGLAEQLNIVRDRRDDLRQAMTCDADVILVSGGSSVGEEDHAPGVLAELGELAIHGIAMRPSSPTGMGAIARSSARDQFVFLLPGNPVSCLCAYDFFAGRAIRALGGRSRDWPYRSILARLSRKISSQVGRVDYARVRFVVDGVNVDGADDDAENAGQKMIEPVSVSGASILTSTTRADGFVIVPADCEGYAPGTAVVTYLYD